MTVADLIHIMQQHDPEARVVCWDRNSYGEPRVSLLGAGEVQPIRLGSWLAQNLVVLEPWDSRADLAGPFPGVVLGSR